MPVRSNGYFYAQLAATSTWNTVSVQARAPGQATNGADALAEETGHLFQATNAVSLQHDDDGNLTSDGRWDYRWDAQNRLILAQTRTNLAASGVEEEAIHFGYDSESRQIKKTVYRFALAICR